MELSFIIHTKPRERKEKRGVDICYNDLTNIGVNDPVYLSSLDYLTDATEEEKYLSFSGLAEVIARDYQILELAKNEKLILGQSEDDARIFPKLNNRTGINKLITEVIEEYFNDSYLSRYDNREHTYLFTITFSATKNRVIKELTKTKILK